MLMGVVGLGSGVCFGDGIALKSRARAVGSAEGMGMGRSTHLDGCMSGNVSCEGAM
jgi:hypothetical protein